MKQIGRGYRSGKPTPGDEKLRQLRSQLISGRVKASARNRRVKVSLPPIKGAEK